MSETSRIEGLSGVQSAARLAEQRMREMLAAQMEDSGGRSGNEAGTAQDQLRKDLDDRLRAAARTAGSDRSDPTAMASDPTALPGAAQGREAASGVMAQLQGVMQQALLQQQLGDAAQQVAAAALLNSLAQQNSHAQPLGAATGSPVLTAGDNGNNAGGGFMPGNQPWLQRPESFSTRSLLPDVATKSNADGSLNPSNDDGATRQRAQFLRTASGHMPESGAQHAVALDAARRFTATFGLGAPVAAGLAAVARQGLAAPAVRGGTRTARPFPGGSARRQRLADFASLHGLDPQTPQGALAFIEHELGTMPELLPVLRHAGSARQAMEIFLRTPESDAVEWTQDDADFVQSILSGLEASHSSS